MSALKTYSLLILISLSFHAKTQNGNQPGQVRQTMLKATRFMVEEASCNGGYVWNYLPDFSRRWGEMEAHKSMIWTQPPGTPAMGQVFLDAYHATGYEYYYKAAEKAAEALMEGQLECGGWNYVIDFAGESSLKKWYETMGKNAWRLEEFQHYYGNATFDDEATFGPAVFLLRLYLEKKNPKFKPAVNRAIDLVLKSQYPEGGWPQRYPLKNDFGKNSNPDYSSFITLNDDAHKNNVRFLIYCYQAFGDEKLLEPIHRAMNCILLLQQKAPQPGWSWQYSSDLKPSGARTYEPQGLYSGATYSCINLLMDYYEITGDRKFLNPVPEALEFLESLTLPAKMKELYPRKLQTGQDLYPSCVEIGTGKPLYVHRTGSNVANGRYYADHNPENQWMPTFSMRALNTGKLKKRYARLTRLLPEEAIENSPLNLKNEFQFPEYFTGNLQPVGVDNIKEIIQELERRPYWEGVFANSNPYIGDGPEQITEGDYSSAQVGDKYDTSPYRFGEDLKGISTKEYIKNMFSLICFLKYSE